MAIIIIVAIVLLCLLWTTVNNNNRDEEEKDQNAIIRKHNIHRDVDCSYRNSIGTINVRYIVDDVNKKVLISNTSSNFSAIPFSAIIGCEMLTDSEVTGGVGRAVVGGILAGGVGAIVGATTAKKKVKSYKVVIYTSSIKHSAYTINLIETEMSTSNVDYQNAVKFAADINASIKAIIEQNNRATMNRTVQNQIPQNDEVRSITSASHDNKVQLLKEYKELLYSGILTQEEFERQKKDLLNIRTNKCPYCGTNLTGNEKFCINCGKKLVS